MTVPVVYQVCDCIGCLPGATVLVAYWVRLYWLLIGYDYTGCLPGATVPVAYRVRLYQLLTRCDCTGCLPGATVPAPRSPPHPQLEALADSVAMTVLALAAPSSEME